MKPNRERAQAVYFGTDPGTVEMIDAIERALNETCAELVDEIASMIGQEPAINAFAFEKMIRDNFGAK